MVPAKVEGESRSLIHNIGWGGYSRLLNQVEGGAPRLTYDRGSVERMWPGFAHERHKVRVRLVLQIFTEELDIPMVGAGSTTFRSEALDIGLDPDECFYLRSAARLRAFDLLDLAIDPPPDLAIEIEITAPLLDRLSIYAKLGVPEVWKHDGEALTALILGENGVFSPSETSLALPFLQMDELARFLSEYDATNDTLWARGFRSWVREVVLPRFAGEGGDARGL